MEFTKYKETKCVYKCFAKRKGGNSNSFRVTAIDYHSGGGIRNEIELYIDDKKFMLDMNTLQSAASFLQEVHRDLLDKAETSNESGDSY